MSPSSHPPSAMTVLGPVQDIGAVLMNEPLIGRTCHAANVTSSTATTGTTISWEDLAAIRQKPLESAVNTTLTSTNTILDELTKASHSYDTILVTTPVDNGRDPGACKKMAQRLLSNNKHILLGTTPTAELPLVQESETHVTTTKSSQSIAASKHDMDRMEQELTRGYKVETPAGASNKEPELIRAGFIGELQLSNQMTESEMRQLKACAVVHATTGAPFLLALSTLEQVPLALEELKSCSADLSKVVMTRMDALWKTANTDATQIPPQLQTVLENGGNICLDRFSISSAIWDLDHIWPSFQAVATMITTLLAQNSAWSSQLLLSSGVCMQLQYTRYGGVGYGAVTDHLIPRLLQQGVTQAQIDAMVRENPKRLLCWWTPPPPLERPKEYLPCSFCKKMFEPILGEYYTKYKFTYCGTGCLREHRKMGFKEL